MTTLIRNAQIVTADSAANRASLLVKEGFIVQIGAEAFDGKVDQTIDADGSVVYPGFIDVHNHGAVGVDVNNADADSLLRVGEFLVSKGVTAWLPTLVPDSDDNYRRVISQLDRLIEMQKGYPVAQALGVHFEGVFANEKMCGALRPQYFKKFTGPEVRELPRPASGVCMTTFAPEVENGIELVKELVHEGWIASIGHTRADVDTLDAAYEAGARHMTHFFNAMTGVHHRDVGVAGWGLSKQGVTFDIIADGVHVDPRMVALACKSKGSGSVSLISDSVAPTGLGDGDFELWNETITVKNARTRNERGSIAGSVATMLDCVKNMRSLGFSDSEVSIMASLNPAKLLGLADSRGSIEPGKRADLVAIDGNGNVCWTMIGGEMVEVQKAEVR